LFSVVIGEGEGHGKVKIADAVCFPQIARGDVHAFGFYLQHVHHEGGFANGVGSEISDYFPIYI